MRGKWADGWVVGGGVGVGVQGGGVFSVAHSSAFYLHSSAIYLHSSAFYLHRVQHTAAGKHSRTAKLCARRQSDVLQFCAHVSL